MTFDLALKSDYRVPLVGQHLLNNSLDAHTHKYDMYIYHAVEVLHPPFRVGLYPPQLTDIRFKRNEDMATCCVLIIGFIC